jgi:DNA repair exonuclease SbcCD nuclease subunit
MSFRFVHTADWQIGRAFAGFPADTAALLREARLTAIDRIAAVARSADATVVMVAGDVFDSELLEPAVWRRAMARLGAHAGLSWLLLPGNHDPDRPGGLWERIAEDSLPANVGLCRASLPREVAPGVFVLPAPLTSRGTARDPTGVFDDMETPDGAIRIGLAHGSITGFGGAHEPSVAIAPDRAKRAGLAYLALGDWHGTLRIDARTWYSGTPEPDRFTDNDPGNTLAVSLPGPAAPAQVEVFPTAHFRWKQIERTVSTIADVDRVASELERESPQSDRLVARLTLGGRLSPLDRAGAVQLLDRLAARLAFLDCRLDGLRTSAADDDLAELGLAGDLRLVAERLAAIASEGGDVGRIGDAALARLVATVLDGRTGGR